MKKPEPIMRHVKRLMNKHHLRAIELSLAEGASARALPASYSLVMDARRQKELTEAAEAAGGSLSVVEATEIVNGAMMRPIATGHGSDVEAALHSLELALKNVSG